MTKWVAAFILTVFATGSSFPIFFTDQIFRSLEQLDEALANGEISQEYYDEAADVFIAYGIPKSQVSDDLIPRVNVTTDRRILPEWKYSAKYNQDLEYGLASLRYDHLSLRGTKFRGAVSLEKRSGQSYLFRNVSFWTWGSRWRLEIGKLNTVYANELTVGHSGLHRELHKKDGFASTLLFPTKHRRNGIQFSREFRSSSVSGFASRLEGDRFYCQSIGGDIIRTIHRADFGLVLLHQQIGEFGAKSRRLNYLAPHIRLGYPSRVLTTESSFQLGGATAHLFQYEATSKILNQSYSLFSYGKEYQNLESGGYAYSDFNDVTIDEVGLEYRDKRPGRRGVAVEQKFYVKAETIAGQLVRWENRLDSRQCVAARLTLEHFTPDAILRKFRVQAIYQNLDIVHDTDTRKLFTIAAELQPSDFLTYENQQKIEQRVLGVTKKYPFRSRHDFACQFNPKLKSILMINYYDSDLNSDRNSQATLAIGQEVTTGREFCLSSRLQTRYKPSAGKLDNWEFRINLEFVL